jgi:hypothetical protein
MWTCLRTSQLSVMNNKTHRKRTANVIHMFSLYSAENNVVQLYNGCEVIDFSYSHVTLETQSAREIRKVNSVYRIYIYIYKSRSPAILCSLHLSYKYWRNKRIAERITVIMLGIAGLLDFSRRPIFLKKKNKKTLADRGCHLVSATSPSDLLDLEPLLFLPSSSSNCSRGWVDPVPDPLLLR